MKPPRRIVSLVPSTTETLYRLVPSERIVGVTDFCVRPYPDRLPEGTRRIGGTKTPDLAAIIGLRPELVLANQEENRREDVLALREAGLPVDVAYPRSVPEAIEDVRRLGVRLDASERGARLAEAAEAALARLRAAAPRRPFRFAYLIWRRPWMAAGRDTFIDALLREGGGENVITEAAGRYPSLSPDLSELRAEPPDRILLSDEPYPFEPRHVDELAGQLAIGSGDEASAIEGWRARIHLVSGEHHSWHGLRMIEGLDAVAEWVASLR